MESRVKEKPAFVCEIPQNFFSTQTHANSQKIRKAGKNPRPTTLMSMDVFFPMHPLSRFSFNSSQKTLSQLADNHKILFPFLKIYAHLIDENHSSDFIKRSVAQILYVPPQ